jgi:hypothetical protein
VTNFLQIRGIMLNAMDANVEEREEYLNGNARRVQEIGDRTIYVKDKA